MTNRDNAILWLLPPGGLHFIIEHPAAGYDLHPSPNGHDWEIVPKGSKSKLYEPKRPLEDLALHRKFAEVGEEPGNFLSFVRTWGPVSSSSVLLADMQKMYRSERVERLRELRDNLRKLLSVIDKINGRSVPEPESQMEFLFAFGRCRPLCSMLPLPQAGALKLKIVPERLWDYMVLQAASELHSETKSKQCSICGNWMRIGPRGEYRADRDTCSDLCRKRKQRKPRIKGVNHG